MLKQQASHFVARSVVAMLAVVPHNPLRGCPMNQERGSEVFLNLLV